MEQDATVVLQVVSITQAIYLMGHAESRLARGTPKWPVVEMALFGFTQVFTRPMLFMNKLKEN